MNNIQNAGLLTLPADVGGCSSRPACRSCSDGWAAPGSRAPRMRSSRWDPAPAGLGRRGDSLTATEIKIAAFVPEGLSNPEIAARLLLSRRTVATHVSHILKKLDVHSRTDIARESALRSIASR
jgi:DNA-binding NarL/FixJ family response regulator